MENYATTGKREFLRNDVDAKAERVKSKAGRSTLNIDKKWTISTNETALLSHVQVDRYDVLKQLSWRIKRSVSFLVVYIVVTIVNAVVLIWEFSDQKHRWFIVALEAFVNLVYLLEILIEILTQTAGAYFSQCWNRVDALICLGCLVFFVISFSEKATLHISQIESRIDTVFLAIRYFVQIVRLCRFAQNVRSIRNMFKQQDVHFASSEFEH